MANGKTQQCGVMVKKPGMPEERPCIQSKGHKGGNHSPDLTGLEFGYSQKVVRLGPPNEGKQTRWIVLDRFGEEKLVRACDLLDGTSTGKKVKVDSSNKNSQSLEYNAVYSHYHAKYFLKRLSYQKMEFFDEWNPEKDGSLVKGSLWIRENLGPKPGPDWELHVLKTKKYPHGFFGPGGIVWRHKRDRHDQALLDMIHEMPKKQLHAVQNEIQSLLRKAAQEKYNVDATARNS